MCQLMDIKPEITQIKPNVNLKFSNFGASQCYYQKNSDRKTYKLL